MEEADRLFEASDKVVRISPEFDAPQFCHDWMAVSPAEVRLTRVMVRGVKKDDSGKTVMRNGAPVSTWLPYSEAGAGQHHHVKASRAHPVPA